MVGTDRDEMGDQPTSSPGLRLARPLWVLAWLAAVFVLVAKFPSGDTRLFNQILTVEMTVLLVVIAAIALLLYRRFPIPAAAIIAACGLFSALVIVTSWTQLEWAPYQHLTSTAVIAFFTVPVIAAFVLAMALGLGALGELLRRRVRPRLGSHISLIIGLVLPALGAILFVVFAMTTITGMRHDIDTAHDRVPACIRRYASLTPAQLRRSYDFYLRHGGGVSRMCRVAADEMDLRPGGIIDSIFVDGSRRMGAPARAHRAGTKAT